MALKIEPDLNVGSCQITWQLPNANVGDDRQGQKTFGLQLVPESKIYPPQLHNQVIQVCQLPTTQNLTPPQALFLTADFNSMTCPTAVRSMKNLETAYEGLKAKMALLLGYEPDDSFLKNGDPYAQLDFSKAPKLDEIVVAYLVFRRDFYGTVMQRLLEFHAARGALVRILVSGSISLDKDKAMFNEMTSLYSNIKIQEYRWQAQYVTGLKDLFDHRHRSQHVKIFATLSHANPEYSAVIVGGRNIHDGFFSKKMIGLSAYPKLIQYGKDDSYAYWRDLEVIIQDDQFTRQVIGHFMTLWDLDSESFLQRSVSMNLSTNFPADARYFQSTQPLVRNFMSLPFKDGRSLEDFYVKLFHSAQKEIIISTPYFHLTKKIASSILEATNRGVEVKLITRINLKGDVAATVLSDVNKSATNKFYKKFAIYEYTEPETILHTKTVVIDGVLTFTGGVNLNLRSFLHDTESGILIYNQAYAAEHKELIREYMTTARQVDEQQKIRWFNKLIFKINMFDEAL